MTANHELPTLSIVIPTYNRAWYLAALLRSIRRQSRTDAGDVVVFVLDNASTDNTKKIVEQAMLPIPLFYIRRPENIGGDANVRSAFAEESGEYVWVIGDDELLPPLALVTTLDLIFKYEPGLILQKAPGFVLAKMESYYPNYIAFAQWCAKNNPHMLIAHSLISAMVVRRGVFDAESAANLDFTHYGHLYGVVNGMLMSKLPVAVPEYSTLVVREIRASFAEPVVILDGVQQQYLDWINRSLKLGIDPRRVLPDYQAKANTMDVMDYELIKAMEAL